jgi:hypothetical protein
LSEDLKGGGGGTRGRARERKRESCLPSGRSRARRSNLPALAPLAIPSSFLISPLKRRESPPLLLQELVDALHERRLGHGADDRLHLLPALEDHDGRDAADAKLGRDAGRLVRVAVSFFCRCRFLWSFCCCLFVLFGAFLCRDFLFWGTVVVGKGASSEWRGGDSRVERGDTRERAPRTTTRARRGEGGKNATERKTHSLRHEILSPYSDDSSSTIGAIMRQGPHHGLRFHIFGVVCEGFLDMGEGGGQERESATRFFLASSPRQQRPQKKTRVCPSLRARDWGTLRDIANDQLTPRSRPGPARST